MEWNSDLSVNVRKFDDQHKKLLNLINSLYDAMLDGEGNEIVGMVLHALALYTATHLVEEEKMLQAHGYPGFSTHKMQHDKLTANVYALQANLASGETLSVSVLEFLRDWLLKHIQVEDKRYGVFLNSKGIT